MLHSQTTVYTGVTSVSLGLFGVEFLAVSFWFYMGYVQQCRPDRGGGGVGRRGHGPGGVYILGRTRFPTRMASDRYLYLASPLCAWDGNYMQNDFNKISNQMSDLRQSQGE